VDFIDPHEQTTDNIGFVSHWLYHGL
jgi:hypothetical protein